MSSEFGKILKISVFGQSHGKTIGVVMDGLPAGEPVDTEELNRFLERRRPGRNNLSTQRREADSPVFLSGLEDGRTCGSPLCAMIENTDTRSGDYAGFTDTPRPGHADYTAALRWKGEADMRGGGHFSGRLTAPLCIAGGIAKQILARRGVQVGAHLFSVGGVRDDPLPLYPTGELLEAVAARELPVLNEQKGAEMRTVIEAARMEADSVGGVIEGAILGLPAGMGSPMFDGIENRLAAALFGIPAVKGLEFGRGFEAAGLRGSENNDPFTLDPEGNIRTETNNCGGILGGITDGMPVVFRLAVKPTPSIGQPQRTVSLSQHAPAALVIHGRHDPCIAHRAVPVAEAVAAAVILDIMLEEGRI